MSADSSSSTSAFLKAACHVYPGAERNFSESNL